MGGQGRRGEKQGEARGDGLATGSFSASSYELLLPWGWEGSGTALRWEGP